MRQRISCLRRRNFAVTAMLFVPLGVVVATRETPKTTASANEKTTPLRVLIVGGGPTPDSNQVAIESNVRYVDKLTRASSRKTILFADGGTSRATVNYLAPAADIGEDEILLRWIFDEELPEDELKFRRPQLPVIDGANTKSEIARTLNLFKPQTSVNARTLLFFTGHGNKGRARDGLNGYLKRPDYNNNIYAGWNNSNFSVRDFSTQLKNWPTKHPVVLVMVQCYSGAFANAVFENGDPANPVVDRDFCGFFASIKERPAAGCTPEIDEANYQDFTSYFFAALSGRNRSGGRVSGADYDRDGTVSMLEAFAWANIHEQSIDVPVATSDAFLRSLPSDGDAESWWQTPYSQVLAAGAPWQKATLQELSERLKVSGENRLQTVRKQFETIGNSDEASPTVQSETESTYIWPPAISQQRENWRRRLLERFPVLKTSRNSAAYRSARQNAVAYLKSRRTETRPLRLEIEKFWNAWGENAEEANAVREAQLLRFVRAARSVVLESELKKRSDTKNLAILKRLRFYESRNPLR